MTRDEQPGGEPSSVSLGAEGSAHGSSLDLEESGSRSTAILALALAISVCGMVGASAATTAIPRLAALWLVHGVALPLGLFALRPRLGRVFVGGVLVIAVLVPAVRTVEAIFDTPERATSAHDGGVIVTRAAAEELIAGRNPYAADYRDSIPPEWRRITMDGKVDGAFENPIRTVYPYLPATFLVMSPTVAISSGDVIGDPRWVMLATYVGAMVAIARWNGAARWARVSALAASTGPLTIVHLSYGTNDTWTASLIVLAAASRRRWPWLTGILLALAVSVKFIVLPAVLIWAAWTWRRQGIDELRRFWPGPALLLATVLPFLVWSPGDLLDDTALFWIGRSSTPFPPSGYGLAHAHADLFHGPLLALTTVGLAVGTGWLAWRCLDRWRSSAVIPFASALVVLGVVIPARTFQGNYLALITGLAATFWLLVGSEEAEVPEPVGDPAT